MAGLLDTVIDWMTSAQRAQQMQGLGNNIKQGLLGIQNAANVTNQAARDTLRTGQLRPNTPAQTALDSNMVNAAMQLGPQAIVWHGSPHKFDKFDSSKIGTGEGAQAYGHGLYLAEAPEVAKTYKASNSATSGFTYAGKQINDEIKKSTAWHLEHYGGDKQAVLDYYKNSYKPEFWDTSTGKKMLKELDKMDYGKLGSGNLYKVDLPDDAIAKMLDWDKPLSQQHPEVQAALFDDINSAISNTQQALENASERRAPTTAAELDKLLREKSRFGNMSGGDYYRELSLGTIAGQPVGANKLKELGIPGIRYLDGGSRGTGAGTSNFVVFPGNENLLTILERNGQNLGLGQ